MSARRWMIVVAVLVSCAVPELDRTGMIRCGTDDGNGLGMCPSGFECRLEHCCPADSPTSTCPAVASSIVGAPCTANDCAVLTSVSACCASAPMFPGGYTTTPNCTSNTPCGEFGVCINFAFIGRAACVRRCTYRAGTITSCRAAPTELAASPAGTYVCIPDPEGRSPNDGVCIPDCTANSAVCGTALQCNPATHTCGNCNNNPALCTGGTTCNRTSGGCGDCSTSNPCPVGSGLSCRPLSGRCR